MSIPMLENKQKYYLAKSGEVKRRAEEYRKTFLRLKSKLWEVVKSFGADEACICDKQMRIRGIVFKGELPAGWTKPKQGVSFPKRGTIPANLRKYFTPSGCYTIETHEELQPFAKWLSCPFHYLYTTKNGGGSRTIGRLFSDGVVYWYDKDGPIMIELPDIAKAKAEALANNENITGNVLDWTPPKGLKEILPEEWELMVARHKLKNPAIRKGEP